MDQASNMETTASPAARWQWMDLLKYGRFAAAIIVLGILPISIILADAFGPFLQAGINVLAPIGKLGIAAIMSLLWMRGNTSPLGRPLGRPTRSLYPVLCIALLSFTLLEFGLPFMKYMVTYPTLHAITLSLLTLLFLAIPIMVLELPDNEAIETIPNSKADTEKYYTAVSLALVLAMVTGIEIVIIYLPVPAWTLYTSLTILSAFKFLAVVWWFMHLRWDQKFLTVLFTIGMVIAGLTIIALLLIFGLDRAEPPFDLMGHLLPAFA